MLNSISWSTYLLSLLLLLAIYYGWVGLQYYRTELLRLFANRRIAEPQQLSSLLPPGETVMGGIAAEPEQLREESELLFAEADPDETEASPETAGQAAGSALLTEVQALADVIRETSENKENFLLLFGLLAEKYVAEISEEQQRSINLLLLQQAVGFTFELTSKDLDEQWHTTINN